MFAYLGHKNVTMDIITCSKFNRLVPACRIREAKLMFAEDGYILCHHTVAH